MAHDVERKKFEKLQFMSIQKAINSQEIPAKEKHVRIAILGTHQEKDAVIFWHVVRRLQMGTDAITCWKFCYVLHKLLQYGHQKALDRSIKYKQQIKNLGNIWIHASQSYGNTIYKYCNYLIYRMDFLHKYKGLFSGDLAITDSILEIIGQNDINSCFLLCGDIMYGLDHLINLQEGICRTLDFSNSISMTGPEQCRLAPCVPVLLDANQLYRNSVKLLFKLHARLSRDVLAGHRERFAILFGKLKKFFYQCSSMLYLKRLIEIPMLPTEAPSFFTESGEHQDVARQPLNFETEYAEIGPEPTRVPIVQSTERSLNAVCGLSAPIHQVAFHQQPDHRDEIIRELREENKRLKQKIERLMQEQAH